MWLSWLTEQYWFRFFFEYFRFLPIDPQILAQAGIIPGIDMTPEAALTKLSYVLSKTEWDLNTKREVFFIFS